MSQKAISQNEVKPSLAVRVTIGAAIALALIIAFLTSDDDPNPEWGKYYMVRPLIIVPLAGAIGGAISYYMDVRFRDGWQKVFAFLFSIVVYVVGLWMGSVLGLAGTYWD